MGFFDIFKNNEVYDKMPQDIKVANVSNIIIGRMVKFGAIDPVTGCRNYFENEDLIEPFASLSIVRILGFPEGSVMTILETYWYLKLKKDIEDDSVIYKKIEEERLTVNFPKGIIDSELNKFVIFRLRLENPELWPPENISDEELNYSINQISGICERYWSNN